MSKTLAVSHILVISENMDIIDLGEYSSHLLKISYGLEPPLYNPPGIVGRKTFSRALIIDHPSTKSKQVFISSDDNIPITDIFSRSNKNGDCIIYGTIQGEPPTIGETAIIVIDPYFSMSTVERLAAEEEVHNKIISRGARYIKTENGTGQFKKTKIVQRLNPIVERIKQVQL